jgi:hypothetical protein
MRPQGNYTGTQCQRVNLYSESEDLVGGVGELGIGEREIGLY